MYPKMISGEKLIAYEGGDGLGKTTVAKLMEEREGFTYIKFPNEDFFSGQQLRKIINGDLPFEPASFQALQVINRIETLSTLDPDTYYVLDRYKLSGYVYGRADGLPEEWLREILSYLPEPFHTVVFYGKPFREDADIYGAKQKKIAELYAAEAARCKYPMLCVDGKTIEEVYQELL